MTKAWDIVGYTYQSEVWCPDCIADIWARHMPDLTTESILDVVAEKLGIDRMDEHSFDSGDFPKVIFSSQVEGYEYCCNCHELLAL